MNRLVMPFLILTVLSVTASVCYPEQQDWLRELDISGGAIYRYHNFTSPLMEESYGHSHSFIAEAVGWTSGRLGGRLETGYMQRSTRPEVNNPEWEIEESELSMYVIPLSGTLLYRLVRNDDAAFIIPYVGIGGGVFSGIERITAKADRDTVWFEAEAQNLRFSGEGHAVVGAEFNLSRRLHGIIEARWTQARDAGKPEYTSEGVHPDLKEVLLDAVKRPNFNFTGWNVEIGLRWYFQIPS